MKALERKQQQLEEAAKKPAMPEKTDSPKKVDTKHKDLWQVIYAENKVTVDPNSQTVIMWTVCMCVCWENDLCSVCCLRGDKISMEIRQKHVTSAAVPLKTSFLA